MWIRAFRRATTHVDAAPRGAASVVQSKDFQRKAPSLPNSGTIFWKLCIPGSASRPGDPQNGFQRESCRVYPLCLDHRYSRNWRFDIATYLWVQTWYPTRDCSLLQNRPGDGRRPGTCLGRSHHRIQSRSSGSATGRAGRA